MTANDPTHHYIKYNWESHSEALRATASRLTEQRHQVRLRKRRRDLPAAFNVILTAIEVLEGYSGSELYIPTNNNLFSEGTRRNAAYTTEVRDALKHLIDSGYLVQAAARQQKFNKDTRRLFWLPHRYRLGERWFKEIGVAPMSKPHEIRRNPLLGYVELRKRRDVHGKRVNMPKVISPQQGKKYRNMLTETAHVLKAHEELMAVTQVALGQRPLPSAQFYLTRIFSNGKLSDGGRTYCSAQGSIKKHERPYLYFNNETTVELDINAIHAHLCYLKCKASFSGDPYTIDGFKRDKVKVAFNIMLNRKGTKDNKSAALTISNNLDMPLESAQALESAILDTHAPIASMFNSGAGLVLQRLDSDIALQVLKHMVASGIPIFPVHDSFIVSARHTEDLAMAIGDSYCDITEEMDCQWGGTFKGGKVMYRNSISKRLEDAILRSLSGDTDGMDSACWDRLLAEDIIEDPPVPNVDEDALAEIDKEYMNEYMVFEE